jgi:hypothetical protein
MLERRLVHPYLVPDLRISLFSRADTKSFSEEGEKMRCPEVEPKPWHKSAVPGTIGTAEEKWQH